jgi:thioredoxin 1
MITDPKTKALKRDDATKDNGLREVREQIPGASTDEIYQHVRFHDPSHKPARCHSKNCCRGGCERAGHLARAVPSSRAMANNTRKANTQNDAQPVVIPAVNFNAEVLESKLPVLVAFWTPWSRSCQILDLVLQELARDLAGKAKVVKVNADDSLDLSLWYDIRSVPTLICFVEGKPRLDIVGTASKEAILARLKTLGLDQGDTLVKGASGAGAATSKGGVI